MINYFFETVVTYITKWLTILFVKVVWFCVAACPGREHQRSCFPYTGLWDERLDAHRGGDNAFLWLAPLHIIMIIIINSWTVRVARAPQMISQPVSSIFPCSPLPSGTLQTPGLSIPSCCLPTSSFVRLVFFPFSLCLVRWFWPELMNGRHHHTTAVYVSLRWSGRLCVVRLPAGSWHRLPRW